MPFLSPKTRWTPRHLRVHRCWSSTMLIEVTMSSSSHHRREAAWIPSTYAPPLALRLAYQLIAPSVADMAQIHRVNQRITLRRRGQFRSCHHRANDSDPAVPAHRFSRAAARTPRPHPIHHLVASRLGQRAAHRCVEHRLGAVGKHVREKADFDRQYAAWVVVHGLGRRSNILPESAGCTRAPGGCIRTSRYDLS